MDIQHLKYFVAVANNKSFTKAATELFISQAALSKQISNLEEKLGVDLFERKKKYIELSASGEVLFNEAVEIINKFENAIELTKKYNNHFTSSLKIGYIGPAEGEFLPLAIDAFSKKYQETEIHIKQDNLTALTNAVQSREIDLIFAGSGAGFENSHSNTVYRLLHRETFVVVFKKSHPLSQKETIEFADLSPYKFILLNTNIAKEPYSNLFKIFNIHKFHPNVIHEAENFEQLIIMLKAGIGCSIIPERALQFYDCSLLDWRTITNNPLDFVRTAVWHKQNENPYINLFINEISPVS